jgi:hypothetical protein
MRLLTRLAAALALLILLTGTIRSAAPPSSPLGYVPDEADLVFEASSPKALVDTLYYLDAVKKLQEIPAAKAFLDATPYRRFYKLVAYFEKELGSKWPELLDQLSGGGAAVAFKFGPNPAPTLLAVQARDEAQAQKFRKLVLELVEQELARQEVKDTLVKNTYQDIETLSLGAELHYALAGKTFLLANNKELLQEALDLHAAKEGKKSIAAVKALADSKKLLPKEPLATMWLNMEPIRKSQQFTEVTKTPRDPGLTLFFGDYVDLLSRTPYVTAGVYKEKNDYLLTFRMPRGREGMGSDALLHLPKDGQPSSRPLLEPKGVLYSESSHYDFASIWNDREKLFGEQVAKDFEKTDANSAKLVSGLQLSKQLQQAGPIYRFVAANQAKTGYTRQPKQQLPAFAFVVELREPEEFGKAMTTVLRGAAAAVALQGIKIKSVEETHNEIEIAGYRFPENAEIPQDVNDIRFNISPCFCRVGNQFVFCSTIELCRDLVDILVKEQKAGLKSSPAKAHYKFYSNGLAQAAKAFEDQLTVQAILDQALTPEEAKVQTKALLDILKHAGAVEVQSVFGAKDFRYDIRYKPGK